MSRMLDKLYDDAEREEINDKMKEFVEKLTDDEKKRLKKMMETDNDGDDTDADADDTDTDADDTDGDADDTDGDDTDGDE